MSAKEAIDAASEADLEEAGERMAEADEDRGLRDNLPFWLWLAFVYGGLALTFALTVWFDVIAIGTFVLEAGNVDISGPLKFLARGLVYIFVATTAIATLVVAPGEYLAAIAGAAEGAAGNISNDEEGGDR